MSVVYKGKCIRIVQYNREDYTRVSSDRAKNGRDNVKRTCKMAAIIED
jgi:hypothetical protein